MFRKRAEHVRVALSLIVCLLGPGERIWLWSAVALAGVDVSAGLPALIFQAGGIYVGSANSEVAERSPTILCSPALYEVCSSSCSAETRQVRRHQPGNQCKAQFYVEVSAGMAPESGGPPAPSKSFGIDPGSHSSSKNAPQSPPSTWRLCETKTTPLTKKSVRMRVLMPRAIVRREDRGTNASREHAIQPGVLRVQPAPGQSLKITSHIHSKSHVGMHNTPVLKTNAASPTTRPSFVSTVLDSKCLWKGLNP